MFPLSVVPESLSVVGGQHDQSVFSDDTNQATQELIYIGHLAPVGITVQCLVQGPWSVRIVEVDPSKARTFRPLPPVYSCIDDLHAGQLGFTKSSQLTDIER
jgi:hypothetical protein